jgi:hypothetical protein
MCLVGSYQRFLLKYPFSVPFLVEPRSILSPGLLLSFGVQARVVRVRQLCEHRPAACVNAEQGFLPIGDF